MQQQSPTRESSSTGEWSQAKVSCQQAMHSSDSGVLLLMPYLYMQGAPKPTKPIVRKLQSVLSTSHAQQQQAVRRASSGISWAAELQLREPEDEDIGHHLDFDSQALREYTAQGMTPDVAAQELQSEQQWPAVLAEQPVEARMQTPELQRERLNAYYRQKAAAEQAAYFDAKLYAEQVQQQNIQQQQPGAPGTIGALSMHAEPSVKAGMAAVSADSVFGRLREVKAMASSLQLPSYGSVNLKQSELEKLSPGLPGLQSQLSKMMQEVSQARTEVLGLRSELGQSTLLGQKSGSTSSVAPDAGH